MFKAFGPWAMFLVGLLLITKYMITDKLRSIMAKLDMVDRHEAELVEIRTVLRMNGCMDANPSCHRRQGEQS
jgi:hypothetical protein